MSSALAATALLMGLAGAPHCAAMCGAVCAALVGAARPGREALGAAAASAAGPAPIVWVQPATPEGAVAMPRTAALLAGRLVSYAALGALVAASVAALASVGSTAAPLRPLWAMLHVGAIALGLWLAATGRQPGWMQDLTLRLSRRIAGPVPERPMASAGSGGASLVSMRRLAGVGLLWGAFPCGLLQSALVVAALADTAVEGAAVMAAFAAGSSIGLLAGPVVWRGLARAGAGWATPKSVTRLAGVLLASASAWALWTLLVHAVDPLTCR